MPKQRFRVVEYSSGFAVRDTETGQERWMSDGVDALFTATGRAMRPGSEYFRKTWQRALNENEGETLEAYFPDQWVKEDA